MAEDMQDAAEFGELRSLMQHDTLAVGERARLFELMRQAHQRDASRRSAPDSNRSCS